MDFGFAVWQEISSRKAESLHELRRKPAGGVAGVEEWVDDIAIGNEEAAFDFEYSFHDRWKMPTSRMSDQSPDLEHTSGCRARQLAILASALRILARRSRCKLIENSGSFTAPTKLIQDDCIVI